MSDDLTARLAGELAVSGAAKGYIRLLDQERALRARRNALACYHMAPLPDEEGVAGPLHPDGKPWQPQECWTVYREQVDPYTVHEEPYGDGSDRGWCDACTRRRDAHVALLATVRRRVGALSSLRAAVRRLEAPDDQ